MRARCSGSRDNLFVGNKLSSGQIRTSRGERVDLRNIKSPIVVFCSWGDDITPPQQALDWILDLYEAVITDAGPDTANRNLVDGKYLFRLERRTLDDIRALGVNNPEDDARFAA